MMDYKNMIIEELFAAADMVIAEEVKRIGPVAFAEAVSRSVANVFDGECDCDFCREYEYGNGE